MLRVGSVLSPPRPALLTSERPTKPYNNTSRLSFRKVCSHLSGGGSRTIMDNGPGNRHRKQHKFSSQRLLGQSRLTGHLRAPLLFFHERNSTLPPAFLRRRPSHPGKIVRPPWTRAYKSIILNTSRSETRSSSESSSILYRIAI